jgi:hypothetical protein
MEFRASLLRTLLYYDLWAHPLKAEELFAFLPTNSISYDEFLRRLKAEVRHGDIHDRDGYYFVKGRGDEVVEERQRRASHARRLWRAARISMHIIKRFPFVRAVFVTGDLSKNSTHNASDVDFFVLTEPHRLWITRALLILFKKLCLLNKKKFFCLNFFATTDSLQCDDRNLFTAIEIGTLKPLYNSALFQEYLHANTWIRSYFPNFDVSLLEYPPVNESRSALQRILELPFRFMNADALDAYLMRQMQRIWRSRYPGLDEVTYRRIFRCTPRESRAFVGDFEEKILTQYSDRLKAFNLS